ncbi:lactoylglutathione lyase [Asticcacaulis sp. W401b]|uniref:lactoylglutathione lyase n=1 Tax=Asticcacaulis sp. W401b TaxID=3388666 RepID=UPI003970FF64
MTHHPNIPHRLLHVMIRVKDLDRSVAFYADALGMRELRREDYPSGAFTLCFLGYDEEQDGTVIELTYNYGDKEYSHGSRFGHLAVAVEDVYAACGRLRQLGVKITREPGDMAFAPVNGQREIIAFIQDPDGYSIELIQRS